MAASTGSPASRRLTKLTPLTTRPSLTSRQGMTRTLNILPCHCPELTGLPICRYLGRIARDTMPSEPATFNTADLVRSTAFFRELSDEQLTAVWSQAKVLTLIRGDVLVRQNA